MKTFLAIFIVLLAFNSCWFAHANMIDKQVLFLFTQKNMEQAKYKQISNELLKSSFSSKLSLVPMTGNLSNLDPDLQKLKWVTPNNVSAVIALGEVPLIIAQLAFEKLSIPIIFTLVYDPHAAHDNVCGIRLLPTEDTQLNYLKLLLPDAKRLGVIYSDVTAELVEKISNSIEDLNKKSGSKINLISEKVSTTEEVWPAWYRLSQNIDVLWMIPDLYLYQSFPILQKDSINKKIPLFAPTTSEKIAQMGAAFALSPDYMTIGSQLIAYVESLIRDSKKRKNLDCIATPIGTSLIVNKKTLNDLNIEIPKNAQQIISKDIPTAPDIRDIRYDATEQTIKGLMFTEAVFQIEESFYVVTASRKREHVQHAPAIMTVIYRNDLQFQQARTLTQILNTVPGFNAVIDHLGDDIFEIRGTRAFNKFLVMIDSHKLNNQIFGGLRYVLDSIPLSLIERIEIIRGPGSAMYGANAFIGVINIITRNPPEKHRLEAEGGVGSFESYQLGLFHSSNFDNWRGLFSGIYRSTEGDELKVNSDAEGLSGSTKDDRNTVGLFGKIDYNSKNRNNIKVSGFYSDSQRDPYIGQAFVLNDRTTRNYQSYYIDVEGNFALNKHNLMLRGYIDQFFYDADWQLEPEGWPVEDFIKGQLAEDEAKDIKTGLEAQFNYMANDELNFLFGGEFYYTALYDSESKDNFTPSAIPNPLFNFIDLYKTDDPWIEETDQLNYSGFGQLHYRPFYTGPNYFFDKFSLIAGLRFDYNDRYGDFWSPRAGIVLGPINNLFVKLLYGKAFRSPNFNEIKAKKQGDVVGNIDLSPEEIDTVEAELLFDKWKWLKPSFNFFYNRINDLIVPDPDRLTPPRRFLNLSGNVDRYGFVSEIRGNLPLNLSYYFNISYVNGDMLDLIPRWKSNFLFGIPFKDRFNLIYYLNYIGERKRAIDDYRGNIDSVLLQNLSFTADIIKDRLKLRIYIRNLFNKEYVSPDPSGLIFNDYPMTGRYIYGLIQLQTSFGSK